MRIIFLSLVALVLTACSKPYDKYVGYWQLDDSTSPKILEIRKEDKDTYLVNENIFQKNDFFGNSKKEQVLEKTEKDSLGFNNGLTVVPFNLSDDGKTLRITNNKYSKISEEEAKNKVKKFEDDKQACKQLKEKYEQEIKGVTYSFVDMPKRNEIGKKYLALGKKIQDCSLPIFVSSN